MLQDYTVSSFMFLNPAGYFQDVSIVTNNQDIWFKLDHLTELLHLKTIVGGVPLKDFAKNVPAQDDLYVNMKSMQNFISQHLGLVEFLDFALPLTIRGCFHLRYKDYTFFGVLDKNFRIWFRCLDMFQYFKPTSIVDASRFQQWKDFETMSPKCGALEYFMTLKDVLEMVPNECFRVWFQQTLHHLWNPEYLQIDLEPMIVEICSRKQPQAKSDIQVLLFKINDDEYRVMSWSSVHIIKYLNALRRQFPKAVQLYKKSNAVNFSLRDLKIAISDILDKTSGNNRFFSSQPTNLVVERVSAYLDATI